MKLLVLSDIHSEHSIIEKFHEKVIREKIALIVICGDITHFGNVEDAEKILGEFTKFNLPIIFVPGNCDSKKLADMQEICGAINVHGRSSEVGGLKFLGVGGSPISPLNTLFEMSETEVKQILNAAYGNGSFGSQFILVSHSPPVNTNVDILWSGAHVGSSAVREFIEEKKPILVLTGHIHESRGKDTINGSLIVNPGPARRGLYATVDIDDGIKVDLGVSQ